MIKLTRQIICIILSAITAVSFCSCDPDDGSGYIFKYDISSNPNNLDPQLAQDSSSMLVLANICEGLLRAGDGGKTENGVITGYTMSEDELTYTFSLKNNVYWKGTGDYEANMTANDFVFAFQRIFDPETHSPYADDFSCIKNGSAVLKKIMDQDSLGVKAIDKYTLEITLESPNANFLYLLTTPAAMPCNEYFFRSTMGKYGLSDATTFSNGDFYLKEWNYDPYWNNNYIILRRNPKNSENDPVYPYSINFFIKSDTSQYETDYLSEESDLILSNGTNKELFKKSKSIENRISSAGLIFNQSDPILANANIKKALAESIDRDKFGKYDNLTAAFGIVPPDVSLLNKSYRELASERSLGNFNAKYALTDWVNGLNELDMVTADGMAIMVSEDFYDPEALRDVTDQWNEKLGFMCGLEVVSPNEYADRMRSGDYEIAVTELTCEYNSPVAVLEDFTVGNEKNIFGFSDMSFDGLLKKFRNSSSLNDSVSYLSEAEKQIISSNIYVPLYYPTNYLLYVDKASDIEFNPFSGQIYFADAKYFK